MGVPRWWRSHSHNAAQRKPMTTAITPLVKRSAAPPSFDNKLHRADAPGGRLPPGSDLSGSFEAGPAVEGKLAASAGGGNPLPDATRSTMEPHFGKDLSSVRLHAGSESAALNRQ